MNYNRSFNLLVLAHKKKNRKKKMLHSHGSMDNPILFKCRREGGVEREREGMLLHRPLAVINFKKFSKKLCPVLTPGIIVP